MAEQAVNFDSGINDPNVLHLYQNPGKAHGVDGFQGVSDAAVAFYRENGYLVVRKAFSTERITAALDEIWDLIDGKYPGFSGIQYAPEVKEKVDQLSRDERRDAVRKVDKFIPYAKQLRSICLDPDLKEVVSRFFDAPATLFDNDGQAHLKPPRIGREKPWHQDHAYFNLPLGTPITGVWIALDRAEQDNGCMHVIPGSHREGPVVHFRRRDWQICDTDVMVNRCVAAVLDPGDLLFFDGLIHHGTPPNLSNKRRRALQFHYHPEGAASTTSDERMSIFGSEGKDVTC